MRDRAWEGFAALLALSVAGSPLELGGQEFEQSPARDPERHTMPDGTKAGFGHEQAVTEIAHLPQGCDPSAEGAAD